MLYTFLNTDCQYNRLALACGLLSIPCRRTFDRRLYHFYRYKRKISTMGDICLLKRLVVDDHSITAIDSFLLKANGHLWHKSSMSKGVAVPPRSGIYRCKVEGYSHTKKDGSLDINYIYNIYYNCSRPSYRLLTVQM